MQAKDAPERRCASETGQALELPPARPKKRIGRRTGNCMRNRHLLLGAVWIALAGSPAAGRAQFQPPNPDELKMTADPKAPGADAVILDNEETDSDQAHAQNYYIRIKVLTDKGKEAATVEIPYLGGDYSIGEIRGRT